MWTAAGFVARFGIMAAFEFWCWVGVRTQIPGLHRGLRLQARVITGIDLRYTSEHVVQPETVADLVNHRVGVTERSVERRVQHDST